MQFAQFFLLWVVSRGPDFGITRIRSHHDLDPCRQAPGVFKQRSIEVTSDSMIQKIVLLNRLFVHLTACDFCWPHFLIEIHRVLGQPVLQHMGDITAAIRLLKVWVRFRNLATLLCRPFNGYKTFTLYNYAIRKRLKLLNRASLFFLDCVISHIFNP